MEIKRNSWKKPEQKEKVKHPPVRRRDRTQDEDDAFDIGSVINPLNPLNPANPLNPTLWS